MKDLTNQRFGRQVAIRPCGKNKYGNCLWLCRCDCGKEHVVASGKLVQGKSRSCGCLALETHIKQLATHGITTGGKPRTFVIWNGIKARCLNSSSISYKNYGGRGITICNEWLSFENFHNWAVANGYKDGLQIDRIDNNKGYCPENCRWVSRTANNLNKRNTRYVNVFGLKIPLIVVCKEINFSRSRAYQCLQKGEDFLNKEIEKQIETTYGQVYFINKFLGDNE